MQNFHDVGPFPDATVDQDRGVDELADAGSPGDRTTDVRQGPQKTGMVENGVAELFGGR